MKIILITTLLIGVPLLLVLMARPLKKRIKTADPESVLARVYFGNHELTNLMLWIFLCCCLLSSVRLVNTLYPQNKELMCLLKTADEDFQRYEGNNTCTLMSLVFKNMSDIDFDYIQYMNPDSDAYRYCKHLQEMKELGFSYSPNYTNIKELSDSDKELLVDIANKAVDIREHFEIASIWQDIYEQTVIGVLLIVVAWYISKYVAYLTLKEIMNREGLL